LKERFSMPSPVRILRAALLGTALLALPACLYQPLYGPNSYAPQSAETLSLIGVSDVETRVAQQVRNHLIFLLQGGAAAPQPTYDLKLRVVDNGRLQAAAADVGDTTAGVVTVTASYRIHIFARYLAPLLEQGALELSAATTFRNEVLPERQLSRDV